VLSPVTEKNKEQQQRKGFSEQFGIWAGKASISENDNNSNRDQYLNNLPEGGLQVKVKIRKQVAM